jgi:hypothetical protein
VPHSRAGAGYGVRGAAQLIVRRARTCHTRRTKANAMRNANVKSGPTLLDALGVDLPIIQAPMVALLQSELEQA